MPHSPIPSDSLGDLEPMVCPECHFDYLHHICVEVFSRYEDEDSGQHVVVGNKDMAREDSWTTEGVRIDREMQGNPSLRRHGLRIHFMCEGCKARPSLNIYQHKGGSYMGWAQ